MPPSDPTPLQVLQQSWCNHLLQGDEAILQSILPSGRLTPVERVSIYRGGYVGALLNALKEIYPVCERLVGNRFFEGMAEYFIRSHPSTSPDLHNYGATFASFIQTFPPAASLAYLSDVAQLEWFCHQAFHGSPQLSFDLNSLITVDPEQWGQLYFKLQPNAYLIQSDYPIHRIWQVNQPHYPEDPFVDLSEGGVALLVLRKGLDLHLDRLTDPEWTFLHTMATGILFEDVCVTCVEAGITDIQPLLLRSIQEGWLGSWSFEP